MKTTPLQEVLLGQSENFRSYPNINREAFTNLERQLQQSWQFTYGVRQKTQVGATVFLSDGYGSIPDGTVIELVVLAVHGTKLSATARNTGAQAKNEIIIMNKAWLPPEANDRNRSSNTISMTLNTLKNQNVTVTMNANSFVRAPGIFMVNEELIEDIGIGTFPITNQPILSYTYRKRV